MQYFDAKTGAELSNAMLLNRHAETVDQFNAPVTVAGRRYPASKAWRVLDTEAYLNDFQAWLDNQLGDTVTTDA